MRITGLEPARLLTIEPKSIASANSAISACQTKFYYTYACFLIITPGVQKVNTRYFCPHAKRMNVFHNQTHTIDKVLESVRLCV